MPVDPNALREFYEAGYTGTGVPEDAARGRRWRELGAAIKSDHIMRLLPGIPAPRAVIEVGCGDGAVLDELGARGVGETRAGIDITAAAIRIAAGRPGVTSAEVFDGERIEAADKSYDLAICTHVLEHVVAPERLLAEIARVARAMIVEVPLEHNLSARRPAARALSEAAGHLQRFDRRAIRGLIAGAGWQVRDELLDPLPLAVHTFDHPGRRASAKAYAKWAVRAALAGVPPVGERLITMHYAVLATPG